MNENIPAQCREAREELWSSWPSRESVPAHVAGCPECRQELADFTALCAASPSWGKTLPESYWTGLAAKTKLALKSRTASAAARALVPALALAAAALLLHRPPSRRAPAPEIPIEAVEQLDLLEHLELLENWKAVGERP